MISSCPCLPLKERASKTPIEPLPGQFHLSCDNLVKVVKEAADLNIPAVMLLGCPAKKDPLGTQAYAKDGIVQKAIKTVKDALPDMTVLTDVCLCQYTDHGHCGMVDKGKSGQ